jgi:hypothetical protein
VVKNMGKSRSDAKREALVAQVEAEALRIRGVSPSPGELPNKIVAAGGEQALADAEPVQEERIYSWHEAISGWEEARIGYARQQAARDAARARAMEPPPEVHGPPAPMPEGYDPIVNGLWDGRPKQLPAPSGKAAASSPAPAPNYNYNSRSEWRDHVLPGGEISPFPIGGSKKYWGPVGS